jgi:cell division septum initiation protein DivIVA
VLIVSGGRCRPAPGLVFAPVATGRFKRALLGYRQADVDAAIDAAAEQLDAEKRRSTSQRDELKALAMDIASRSERIDELERVANRLAEGIVERERELKRVRAELAEAGERSAESLAALAALADELEAIRKQARGQATRIRMTALREAAEVSERLAELARRPGEVGERMVESIQDAIRRIAGDEVEVQVAQNGHADATPEEIFEGLVEVEVGPLADFAKLVIFEDAARSVDGASEISIKKFSDGRATLEMNLERPIDLLNQLERRCDLEFRVRDNRGGRLILDVDE